MDFSSLQSATQTCLMWVGFGTVCGMTAKLVLPGRDPGGALVTLLLGIGGSLIGGATFAWVAGHPMAGLISPAGFAVSIGGALVLLISHRVLGGRMFNRGAPVEEVIVGAPNYTRRRGRAARFSDVD